MKQTEKLYSVCILCIYIDLWDKIRGRRTKTLKGCLVVFLERERERVETDRERRQREGERVGEGENGERERGGGGRDN